MKDGFKIPFLFQPEVNEKISKLILLSDSLKAYCERVRNFEFVVSSEGYVVEEKHIKFNICLSGVDELRCLLKEIKKENEELHNVILYLLNHYVDYDLEVK